MRFEPHGLTAVPDEPALVFPGPPRFQRQPRQLPPNLRFIQGVEGRFVRLALGGAIYAAPPLHVVGGV